MKRMRLMALGGAIAVAACVPRTEAPPPPPPRQPVQPVRRPPPPPPPPAPVEWSNLPLTPGGWTYANEGNVSQATFGPAGGASAFIVRCDRVGRQVLLVRPGAAAGAVMTLRTSFGARNVPVARRAEAPQGVTAVFPASDRYLDGIAFSRGRFTVENAGQPMLVIPVWAEPARVVEDCRG